MEHEQEIEFRCMDCFKTFKNPDALIKHEITHSANKPFSCDECEEKFAKESYLRTHEKAHKDGNCDQKMFSQSLISRINNDVLVIFFSFLTTIKMSLSSLRE